MGYQLTLQDTPVCLECGSAIEYGRTDKKFCCERCKNVFHNRRNSSYRSVRLKVTNALSRNYDVLDRLVKLGVTAISIGDASQMGFNTEYVTSHHKVGGHNEYRCFDIKYCLSDTRLFKIERVERL